MSEDDTHDTYVELRGDGVYYFWCTADDCHHDARRTYLTESEARDAAASHERNPG